MHCNKLVTADKTALDDYVAKPDVLPHSFDEFRKTLK